MILTNEKHRYKELADFFKTRRAKILPSQVGLSSATRRRTPGLRREEVAQLAGIGITWYTWLEQGRTIHVSTQVIESLSKVLLLDKQERIHLYRLANQPLPADIPGYQGTVSPILQHVLDSLIFCPSLVTDQRWNVIAWNKAAFLIFGDFSEMNVRERNIVWAMFTDNKYKQLFVDWNLHAKGLLGRFRSTCGQYIEDSWLAQFIDDLKMQSTEFNLWWPLHEIQSNGEKYKQLNHPIAGILDFEVSNFDVSDNSGLKLIVHTPLSGTDTATKMKLLLDE
ncbi:XRE family transcriptional regulator [Desulfosporosinus fructosivorans]|uniref:XRE family transcriptional regulator n=1 Tax=Desulfosporosinus fructosivorans TaxID=2018669 RepID=A0A4Z0QY80_9FIRM|nr:helix-turn-helix transcriptional regulator [Desulfosporosinus fructosivorans]TGE34985.1 XRE family transcriptional regulator [Desulfosporosinus fructosivorans]